jgi:hypothetical protein
MKCGPDAIKIMRNAPDEWIINRYFN